MENFEKIINRIQKEDIQPIKKWVFRTRDLFVAFVFFTSLLLGSISFSIILYAIKQSDFQIINHFYHSKIETFLVILPYFWLILLLFFTVLAFVGFKGFKKSYKFSFVSTLTLNFLLSVIIGMMIFISGGSQLLERKFADNVNMYQSLTEYKRKIWLNPDKGLLAGDIFNVNEKFIYIKDFDKKIWKVNLVKETFILPMVDLIKGEQVKLTGKKLDDSTFEADMIRPWEGIEKIRKKK